MIKGKILLSGRDTQSTIHFDSILSLPRLVDIERSVVVADDVTSAFIPPEFAKDRLIIVRRGEAAKSMDSLELLYGEFLRLGVGRDWTVIGVGGGSVSDLAGLAASTWLRGIDLGFVPTTLLGMVDASLGGKNGIDVKGYKNLIGTFWQPRFVIIDPKLLASLPEPDLSAGLAEALKHGVIDGEHHLAAIEGIVTPAGTIDRKGLDTVIRLSIELKTSIVGSDEREKGDRRKLNLGHTIGHGIEAASGLRHGDFGLRHGDFGLRHGDFGLRHGDFGLRHGECVAAGLASASRLAIEHGGSQEDGARVIALLERLGLASSIESARLASSHTTSMPAEQFREAIIDAIIHDKKREGDDVLFALPMAIGRVIIMPIPISILSDFVRRAP